MKIAFIAVKGIPMSGGIESYTLMLASKLAEFGNDVIVYTTRHHGNTDGFYQGFMIKTIPSSRIKNLEKMTLVFNASCHMMFQNYDIVHYHALGPSIFAFMAKITHKKVIIQSHGIEYRRSKWGFLGSYILKTTERLSVNMGDCLTVVSKTLKKYFWDTYQKRTIYIPTAVELPDEQTADEDILKKLGLVRGNYYLFLARIVKEKGAQYLIPAYKSISSDKKLVIAGKIELSDPFHSLLIKMAQNDKRIIFIGDVSGKVKDNIFKGAYAFCQPSELEGLSVSLLEAMSYKKCCIVSDISENMEVAGGHSISFKNKNIVDCARALSYAENNPDKVISYGEAAFSYIVENHQIDKIARQIENMYKTVINQ